MSSDTPTSFSVPQVLDGWYAMCRSDELRETPISRTLLDCPIAIFRDKNGAAAALIDRCPHRSAPLSLGSVDDNGHLACRYHGWRFDTEGVCQHVPGLLDGSQAIGRNVMGFPTHESDGFVWLWARCGLPAVGTPIRIPHYDDQDYLVVVRHYDVECSMHAALENALDVPHTAFVHRGDFRGKESRELEAVRRRIDNGVEVEYIGEPPLSGPTTDKHGTPLTSQHWDRFFMPSVAQVEYRTGDDRHLVSTLPHCPVSDFHTRFWLVSCWKIPPEKHAQMRPVIEKQLDTILDQDVEILRKQNENILQFGEESYRSTELDLMGPEILRMLKRAARELDPCDANIEKRIRMRVY